MSDESDWVEMTHPDLPEESLAPDGRRATVPRSAFEEEYKPKGWQEVGATPSASPAAKSPRSSTSKEG